MRGKLRSTSFGLHTLFQEASPPPLGVCLSRLLGLWGTSEPRYSLGAHLGEKVRVSRNLGIEFLSCKVSSRFGV